MTETQIPKAIGETTSFAAIEERFKKIEEVVKARPPGTAPAIDMEEKRRKQDELRRQAGIPKRHAKRQDFAGEQWKAKLASMRERIGTGFIVALVGTRGVGKTQMGVEMVEAQIESLRSAQFTTAMDVFLSIKASFRRDASVDERQIVEDYCRPKFLVIDEVQERAESAWEDRILTHIINTRYNDEKDTLLIGNITPEAFKEAMGNSVVSRLIETGGIMSCDWESFRK